jgi:hypothetical protein
MAVQQAEPAVLAAGLPVAEPPLSPTSLPDPDEVVITPEAGGVLQSANGRVRLEFPAGAVAQRTVVRHSAVPPEASTPPELFYLCDLTATVEDSGTPFIRRPLPSPRPRLVAPQFYKEISRQILVEDVRLGFGTFVRSFAGSTVANYLPSLLPVSSLSPSIDDTQVVYVPVGGPVPW